MATTLVISADPAHLGGLGESGLHGAGVPAVTVVIPCFNAAHFVTEAVDSVLDQEMDGVQIVLVNDGSPDGQALHKALARYGDRIELIDQPHLGLSAARNRGIAAARGDYLAFLDADDLWKPGFLQKQLRLLHASGDDLLYCDAELFGDSVEPGSTIMAQFPSEGPVTPQSVLLKQCLIVMSTVVGRTDAVRRVGGFDQRLHACEDLDLWMRMLIDGARISYHRESLVLRRIHPANMSADSILMVTGALDIIRRYSSVVHLSGTQRRTLKRRIRRLNANRHELLAWRAATEQNVVNARGEFWKAFRADRRAKYLGGALALTLFPRLALRMLLARIA